MQNQGGDQRIVSQGIDVHRCLNMVRAERVAIDWSTMKHKHTSQLLERRIRQGDYSRSGLPAERDLAGEIGVSRVTIRRALEELQTQGLIERLPNRRAVLSHKARSAMGELHIAFVAPSSGPQSFSLDIQQWAAAAEYLARQAGAQIRVVTYHHWDDSAISDAFRSYDGVFFVTSAESIPAWAATLLGSSDRVISLSDDLTHLGVPSIVLFPHLFVSRLLVRLHDLGHRRIACFNIQGHNAVTLARIEQWRLWCSENCCNAELIDLPCQPGENTFEAGLRSARACLSSLSRDTTAIFCVTLPAAMGAIRAVREAGMRVGSDVAVCTVDGEGLAEILVPSITCFQRPDARKYMTTCIEWFAGGGGREDWRGSLLVQPTGLNIFEGDSTTPPHDFGRGSSTTRRHC
jgi:DNA-binding LacI/PurR family transcriptional regulator